MTETIERMGYSIAEWAQRWGLSRGTVYNLARDQKLTISKVQGKSLITAAEDKRFADALNSDGDKGFRSLSAKRRDVHAKRSKKATPKGSSALKGHG